MSNDGVLVPLPSDVPPPELYDVPPEVPFDRPNGPSTGGLRLLHARDIAMGLLDEAKLRHEYGADAVAGEQMGLREVDENLHIEPGRVFVLAGGPGDGKTALALQWSRHVATRAIAPAPGSDRPAGTGAVLYVLTEMTAKNALERAAQEFAHLSLRDLRAGMTDKSLDDFREALRELWRSGLTFLEAAGRSVDDVAHMVREWKRSTPEARMVVIDNMTGLAPSRNVRRNAAMPERVGDVMRVVHALSMEESLPIWLLAHTTRPASGTTRTRPQLTDIANSSDVERFAHAVCFISKKVPSAEGGGWVDTRPDPRWNADPAASWGGREDIEADREFHVAKNRDGQLFTCDLRFIGEQMRFEDPKGRTVRPYELPEAESPRQAEYRSRLRTLEI